MLVAGDFDFPAIEAIASTHGGISVAKVSVFSGKPPRRCACIDYADGSKGFLDDISVAEAARLLELAAGSGNRHGG